MIVLCRRYWTANLVAVITHITWVLLVELDPLNRHVRIYITRRLIMTVATIDETTNLKYRHVTPDHVLKINLGQSS